MPLIEKEILNLSPLKKKIVYMCYSTCDIENNTSNTFVTGGLETEAEYKYRGHNEKCSMDKSKVRVKINGSVSISSNETGQISNQIITLNFYFLDSTCRLKFQKNGSCVL